MPRFATALATLLVSLLAITFAHQVATMPTPRILSPADAARTTARVRKAYGADETIDQRRIPAPPADEPQGVVADLMIERANLRMELRDAKAALAKANADAAAAWEPRDAAILRVMKERDDITAQAHALAARLYDYEVLGKPVARVAPAPETVADPHLAPRTGWGPMIAVVLLLAGAGLAVWWVVSGRGVAL